MSLRTCFYAPTNVFFQKILAYFVKPPARILDLTYGEGHSWEGFQHNTLLGAYEVVKMDIRRLPGIDVQADCRSLPFRDSYFDCAYFDPPFFVKEGKGKRARGTMLSAEDEVSWTHEEYREALEALKHEIPRVLKPGGVLIFKIMDEYVGHKFYPNHFIGYEALCGAMTPVAHFMCPLTRKGMPGLIVSNVIHYLVFRRRLI